MSNLLHQSVMIAAQKQPEKCAFKCGSAAISYGQLDDDSGKLASFLVQQGAKPGDRIGVFMPRCIETIIAVYGIFKAGCIFVPVDPHLTAGGVTNLVKDCGMRLLLTHPRKTRVLGQLFQRETGLGCVVGVGEDFKTENQSIRRFTWNAFNSESVRNANENKISANDAAYIMYSSGSTGQPKGITHTHASGLSYSRLSIKTYDVTSQDIIANHSPISFDMSTFGYLTSPLAGATTVLIPEAHTSFPSSLAKLIEAERISIWYSVPLALIQLLLRTRLESFDMSSLRWVKFGGEPFPPKHLKSLMQVWPHARFSNVYGPAEVNQCTYYHVPSAYAIAEANSPIPIGRVWDETDGLILDEEDRILTNGQSGELIISSPTMMQGYWGRPDRNATAFWSPNTSGNDRRYYRTGDLVQRQPSGEFLLLGRKDRQIKIRGYRIELDEVENALNGLDEIEEAGVYCVSVDDTKEIHAAAIIKTNSVFDIGSINSRLSEVLSTYSIPKKLKLVEKLPRTTSGKIDRNQLSKEAEGLAD